MCLNGNDESSHMLDLSTGIEKDGQAVPQRALQLDIPFVEEEA